MPPPLHLTRYRQAAIVLSTSYLVRNLGVSDVAADDRRIVGVLFLAAFFCYGVGSALADRAVGPALMLLNSVVVATIVVLVFRVFRRPHPRTSAAYLIARGLEAILLAVGVVGSVSMGSAEANSLAYQGAMLVLGAGSVPFCLALLRDQFVPRWLAIWGIVGYAVLAAGALLELLGLAVGLVFAIPGGSSNWRSA
jgi:hypothetical protein